MADFDVSISRGDKRTLTITTTNPADDTPYSLTGKTVWFTAKRSKQDLDAAALIAKSTAGGINVMGSPNEHKAVVTIDSADTASFKRDTVLLCDVQVKDGTDVFTVAEGVLRVKLDVKQGTV